MWKKYLWVKNLVFFCLVSYLLARIGNTLLLANMSPTEHYQRQDSATREVLRGFSGKKSLRHYRPISQRNVFHSTNKGEEETRPRRQTSNGKAPLQKSDLNVHLVGTVAGSSQDSFAILEDPQTGKQELFHVDDMIQGQTRVVAISRCMVVVFQGGTEKILECPDLESRQGSTSSPIRRSRPSSRDESDTVRKLSEGVYEIDPEERENALGDYNQIMTQVGIGPNFQDGKQDGLRLLNVRPNSFWAKAGLKKGDVIRRVNDLQLSTVDNAMQAFDTMRKEKEVTMEISRAGTSHSIHWEIR